MVRLCLLWLLGRLALSSQTERCFLYPVQEKAWSPDFLLNQRGDTLITINNINPHLSVVSRVTLDSQCIVQLGFVEAPPSDGEQCPTFTVAEEYAHLFIRRLEGGVGVRAGGSRTTDEVPVQLERKENASLRVTTSYYINVAYDCPLEQCYQLEDASIHRSFGDTLEGTLFFRGKVIRARDDKGYIDILGVPQGGRTDNRRVSLNDITSLDWHKFTLLISFRIDNERSANYNANISIHHDLSSKPLFAAEKLPFRSPDLYLRFRTTKNMRWEICRSSAHSLASTSASSTEHLCKSPNSSTGHPDSLKEGEAPLLVLGVVCGLLLLVALLLIAYVFHLRKRPFRNTISAATPTQSGGVDLKELQVLPSQWQTASRQEKRKSHESINSIYDSMDTDAINVSK